MSEYPITIIDKEETYHCKEVAEADYFKLVTDKDEVLILYSPGFGAGWGTWNSLGGKLIKDSRLIQYVFTDKYKEYDYETFMKEIMQFDKIPYEGGFKTLSVEPVPLNKKFVIHEYDGSEDVITIDQFRWIEA